MAEEKIFENKVKKFLDDGGNYFLKNWGGGQFTKSGVPDLFACVNGVFFGIELKASNGKPSELQLIHLREIDKAGGVAILLYPKDFDEFKKMIEDAEIGDSPDTLKEHYSLCNKWREYYKKMKGE